jgi:predicted ArsR family transcriptional regulator
MTFADTLKGRVLRELRGRVLPASTGELAELCAFGFGLRHPCQQTNALMRELEAAGVVTRFPPVKSGQRGRPANRWLLATRIHTEGSAAA